MWSILTSIEWLWRMEVDSYVISIAGYVLEKGVFWWLILLLITKSMKVWKSFWVCLKGLRSFMMCLLNANGTHSHLAM